MILSVSGERQSVDDFVAGVGRVIASFAFLSVGVADVVFDFLVEGVGVSPERLPEGKLFFKFHSAPFEEEPELQAAPVLEVVVFFQTFVEMTHAKWKGRQVDLVDV